MDDMAEGYTTVEHSKFYKVLLSAGDMFYGSIAAVISGVLQGLVWLMKLAPGLRHFFIAFLDPALQYEKYAYGIGKFNLNENHKDAKPIKWSEINGIDDIHQQGAIDVIEAILTSLKWSLVPLSIVALLDHQRILLKG